MSTGHGFVCLRVVQKPVAFGNNALSPGAHQSSRTGQHGFWPLGLVAHHQYGLSERWRLLLNAARIRQDEGTLHERGDERNVFHRLDQGDTATSLQMTVDSVLDARVRMHRIHYLHIMALCYLGQRGANLFDAISETLAPVRRYQNEFALRVESRRLRRAESPA